MELVFDIQNTQQFLPPEAWQKTFKQVGGVIGRGEDCDWILPDRKRHLSSHHALISYRDGRFFLTDTSSNGIQEGGTGMSLRKGEALLVECGNVYVLGDFEIRARLVPTRPMPMLVTGASRVAGSVIPDDAFLALEPLQVVDAQAHRPSEIDALIGLDTSQHGLAQRADFVPVDREYLRVPTLIEVPLPMPIPVAEAPEPPGEAFWTHFGQALGIDLAHHDQAAREALALRAASLLDQCVVGLQQSLGTRSELKNQLRLAQTAVQGRHGNPLKSSIDASEALEILLRQKKPGQWSAEQAVCRAFNDLQAHQVALLTASRAAIRGALEHFSPQQQTLRMERDSTPWFRTSAACWRAYSRYHQTLRQDDDWCERLLTRDFAQAYEEQVRLISSLHTDARG